MSIEKIIFAAACWVSSLIFGGIAIWAFRRKDPMHFWSGSTVKPEEITDIPAYNRANGLMWALYTACLVVTGLLSLFSIKIACILLLVIFVPGIAVLIFTYNRIYNKYKNPSAVTAISDKYEKPKTPKAIIATVIIFFAVVITSLSLLFLYGEKDPEIIIHDDSIQIKAMYGLDIDFSEIADITLIEMSMKEIGTGRRTNGYGGLGGTFKGNFKSEALGETLLFVQSKSSPTVKIDRIDKKDVYISFRNSEKTEQLYRQLIEKFR
mgnify:FL=1